MRGFIRKFPFPFVGYVFFLFGFCGLGLFVAALAQDAAAVLLGFAMVSAYAAGTACFLIRRSQIANTPSSAAIRLSLDPMRGDTDRRAARRYLATYRAAPDDAHGRETGKPLAVVARSQVVHGSFGQPPAVVDHRRSA